MRADKDRRERLAEAMDGTCETELWAWYERVVECLTMNKIEMVTYAKAVYDCLYEGQVKGKNIMLVGRSNTGKTSMLKPLQKIFKDHLFENPSRDRYGWKGVEKSQVMLLNDFRWTKETIALSDFLNLLEGETVKLPTPKNHFPDDIVILVTNDIPILATSAGKIEYNRFSPNYREETEMMDKRWRIFEFSHVFTTTDISPCAHCFCRLITSF